MRYDKGHKAATRQHILDIASKRFRKDGVSLGLSEIMKAAGLTNGGFYTHFESKDDLVRSALLEASAGRRAWMESVVKRDGLEGFFKDYLGRGHRDRPETGCVFGALSSESARLSRRLRSALTQELHTVLELISEELSSHLPNDRSRKAMQIFGVLVGSLQLARTIDDPVLSEKVLEAGLQAALAITRCPKCELPPA
jgi:TetR/AcrR family transcriptional regulator, transcriptional repressor for nem operon